METKEKIQKRIEGWKQIPLYFENPMFETVVDVFEEFAESYASAPTREVTEEDEEIALKSRVDKIENRLADFCAIEKPTEEQCSEIISEVSEAIESEWMRNNHATTSLPSERELAKWMHDEYEIIAKQFGWNTQESTKVEFKDLPPLNKDTMLELARRIKDKWLKSFSNTREVEGGWISVEDELMPRG